MHTSDGATFCPVVNFVMSTVKGKSTFPSFSAGVETNFYVVRLRFMTPGPGIALPALRSCARKSLRCGISEILVHKDRPPQSCVPRHMFSFNH